MSSARSIGTFASYAGRLGGPALRPLRELDDSRALERALAAVVLEVHVELHARSLGLLAGVCDQREQLEVVALLHRPAVRDIDGVETTLGPHPVRDEPADDGEAHR